MAGLPWIKVWTRVTGHPKIQRLERAMRIKDALGVVVRLWAWTADYAPGGDIPEAEIGTAARFARGDASRLPVPDVLSALISVGLLDRIPEGYRVHDWQDMQTVHVEAEEKRRAQAAERQRAYRARHGPVTPRNAPRNALPGVTVTGEIETEKETEKETETTPLALSPTDSPPSPVLVSLPCVGSGGKDYGVTAAQVASWRGDFPGVDVEAEVRKARAWLEANPTRRKTTRGTPRFLVSWLGRAQNERGNGAIAPSRGPQPVGKDWTKTLAEVAGYGKRE